MASKDILLPGPDEGRAVGRQFGAFVPIAVALIGIMAVFLGGVSARTVDDRPVAATPVDPITTGSIVPAADLRRAMELLDR
jgi:hypothetical protein